MEYPQDQHGVQQLCIKPNMRNLEGAIFHTFYHTARIVGGRNIFYYDINPGSKNFLTLLCLIARNMENRVLVCYKVKSLMNVG